MQVEGALKSLESFKTHQKALEIPDHLVGIDKICDPFYNFREKSPLAK